MHNREPKKVRACTLDVTVCQRIPWQHKKYIIFVNAQRLPSSDLLEDSITRRYPLFLLLQMPISIAGLGLALALSKIFASYTASVISTHRLTHSLLNSIAEYDATTFLETISERLTVSSRPESAVHIVTPPTPYTPILHARLANLVPFLSYLRTSRGNQSISEK